MSQGISLIAGLGNPGPEYAETRHNAGFRFLDAVLSGSAAALRRESRFNGDVARVDIGGREVWLLAPQTFMNHSGESVAKFANYYRIPVGEILVVHDELDLPPGTVRLKKGGGVAGHNGLKDIAARLGPEFWRVRIGIGHPGDRAAVMNYVLHPPREEETRLISDAIERSLEVWPMIFAGEMEKAMHRLHTQPKD